MTEADEAYTTAEAAKILRVGARRVQQLLDAGDLVGEKSGGVWRVAKWSVHRYLDEHGPGKPRVSHLERGREASDEERRLRDQLGELREEIGRLRGRAELEETALSTLQEQLQRERERADQLEEELREARKGFWARLIGGRPRP